MTDSMMAEGIIYFFFAEGNDFFFVLEFVQ